MKQLKDYQFKSQKEALEAIKVELSSLMDKTQPESLKTPNNAQLNDIRQEVIN